MVTGLDVLNRQLQQPGLHRLVDEPREVALLGALAGQIGTKSPVGLLGDDDRPAYVADSGDSCATQKV